MRRLITLLAAVPVIVSLFAAHFLGWRILNKASKLSLTLEEILDKLAPFSIHFEYKKRIWSALPLSNEGSAYITEKNASSKQTRVVAEELLKVGLSEIHKTHPAMTAWRFKVLKLTAFVPPFVILLGILGTVVNRIPMGWSIALFVISLAISSIMLWLSRAVEKEGAIAIISLLERKRVLNRLSEEEELVAAIQAWTWVGILPRLLIGLLGNINKAKEVD